MPQQKKQHGSFTPPPPNHPPSLSTRYRYEVFEVLFNEGSFRHCYLGKVKHTGASHLATG